MLRATFDFTDTLNAEAPREATPDAFRLRSECLARADLYRILAGVFAGEPSIPFLASLRDPALLRALGEAGIVFEGDFLDGELSAVAEDLACEYATLFASSGGFPPVESVRLTGRFKQEPFFQVKHEYRRMGFEQTTGRFDVFPDQLGVELMFVAELLARAAVALESEDFPAFKKLEKDIKRFWTLHLGRWVRGYGSLIERASSHSFYRGMARFLAGFASEEIAAMDLRLDDLDQGQLEVPKSEIKMEFNPDEPVCGGCPTPLSPSGPGAAARVIQIAPSRALRA